MAPSLIPSKHHKSNISVSDGKYIDNTPLMQINYDSSLNDKLVNKHKHNKRMQIDSPNREYMKSSIDLSFPDVYKNGRVSQGGLVITDLVKPSKMLV
jgi:hypothetical protein